MGIAGSWAGGAGYRAAWLLWLAGDAEKKAAFVVCPDARVGSRLVGPQGILVGRVVGLVLLLS